MTTLLISDLHLEDKRPEITRAFFHLLERFSGRVERLFILGDFFELWLGDDVLTPTATQVAERLSAFANAGSKIFIMHGNRDFLLGKDYAAQCQATLIEDPYPTVVAGRQCLLMHGDSLCIDDLPYLEFRRMVRDPQWQQAFLGKTVAERIAFGQQARAQSQADQKQKSDEILDVNADEVVRIIGQAGVPLLIHGHTHRPAIHELLINGQDCQRVVLGDWHSKGWFILADDTNLELESFEFPAE